MYDVLVVGCGLCGMVVARELAEKGKKVHIIERRDHIGGNIYDYYDENGILVQKYGPHVFFTDNEKIEEYITRFVPVHSFYPECRTFIDGKAIPMPFNFASIDMIYEDRAYADKLKESLINEFGENTIVSVVDVLNSDIREISEYGRYMYEHEYRKYSAKQWGRPIETIDPSVFLRVPVYISEKKSYLRQNYQYMPEGGFTELSKKLINHPNISIELGTDALDFLKINDGEGRVRVKGFDGAVVYTGPIDALFQYKYGRLPYRALEFVWKTVPRDSAPCTPLSAFPEGDKYIRITDYTQFPPQKLPGKAVIAIEFPVEYNADELCGNEPYYPTLTSDSKAMYEKYAALAKGYHNLFPCGRLADFKYYNMDAVIERAFSVASGVMGSGCC